MLAEMEVRLPDQPVAAHALPGVQAAELSQDDGLPALRAVHEHRQVPLAVRGHETKVTVIDRELAGENLQGVCVPGTCESS